MDANCGEITEMENVNSVNGSGNTAKQIRTILMF